MYDPEHGYPRVVPYVLYADPTAAVRWLGDVLGLRVALRIPVPTVPWATPSSCRATRS